MFRTGVRLLGLQDQLMNGHGMQLDIDYAFADVQDEWELAKIIDQLEKLSDNKCQAQSQDASKHALNGCLKALRLALRLSSDRSVN